MADIINLPNGSQWDNDLSFAENSLESQAYLFEILQLALSKDPSVLRCDIGWNNTKPYYNHLERYIHEDWNDPESSNPDKNKRLKMTCSNWYEKVGEEWTLAGNTVFKLEII